MDRDKTLRSSIEQPIYLLVVFIMEKLTWIIYTRCREMLWEYVYRRHNYAKSMSESEIDEKENNKLYSIVMLWIIEYEKRNCLDLPHTNKDTIENKNHILFPKKECKDYDADEYRKLFNS